MLALVLSVLLALSIAPACNDSGSGGQGGDPLRPDVVVIVIDTLRADRLPFYGHDRNTAPFLDSLARRSLVFDNAWASSSWTAPATASIFTGLDPNEHGVRLGLVAGIARETHEQGYELNRIPDEIVTLPVLMQRLGYRTFGASANPNIGERMGFERGFDRFAAFSPEAGPGAAVLTKNVLAWKEELMSSSPFFLYLHFADPHGPYVRHAEWIESTDPPPRNRLDDIVAYDSEIRHADEHIRRIFEELGLGDDTLVIMTSDHGQEFRDHGFRGHGFRLYSELTRVPLFVHRPADPRLAGRATANVATADIMATLRDLLDVGGEGAGHTLLEASRQHRGDRRAFSMRTLHQSTDGTVRIFSIVADRYKLIVDERSGETELYDLEADPGEEHDIAAERPAVVRRLRAALAEQRAHARATARHSRTRYTPSPEMIEMLEELGYADGGVNTGERP